MRDRGTKTYPHSAMRNYATDEKIARSGGENEMRSGEQRGG
jgi:hypothetical protein